VSWHRPAGTLEAAPDPVRLTPKEAGWEYTGLHVLSLEPGERRRLHFDAEEVLIIPLSGSYRIESDPLSTDLAGRTDVFGPLTDRVYLGCDVPFELETTTGGEVAVATARAEAGGEAMYLDAGSTSVELRGGGQASRQINGLLTADVPGPERIIVVEVLTPAGNWSSFPPHKHDEWGDDEVPLEEIYYFRIDGDEGFGFHRTYTADSSHDETVTVRDGDVYLIPRGYHGPCVAAPGYDMYYLNVMAGPERAWRICTDPAHAWITAELESTPIDPRLPVRRSE
jgi:5-deoxy-glucuronate isomerase